jgi:two-component system OmpR family sensor kinase
MSLRARLALLYTSIVGGILLLFGVAVYVSVSVSLITQADNTLKRAGSKVWPNIYIEGGELRVSPFSSQDLTADVYVQVWGRDARLNYSSVNLGSFTRPLDPKGLGSNQSVFRDAMINSGNATVHLRVFTVPLMLGDRLVGDLMVATSLAVVDATLQALLAVLLIGAAVSMVAAGVLGWFSTRQALAPLGDVTRAALQITRADDLSRRIPYKGPPDDEVGQLINAFNQTLSRLENLFNTQRRFIADVGHELRTPLTVIKGNLDLMRRIGMMDAESMESIDSEVDRLSRMVGDLLLLAQAESGKIPLDHRLVELDTVLLEVFNEMKVLARGRLRMELGEIDQVQVCGDHDRLKQVLMNLISNAIQYTPAGGVVTVGLGKVESRARLTVIDSGPGIPAEDLPHIFERFYRGEKARTRSKDGKGFGLGLSIAYWIVRNHGGQIEVSSKEGSGTTFCVWLPLAEGNCQEQKELA